MGNHIRRKNRYQLARSQARRPRSRMLSGPVEQVQASWHDQPLHRGSPCNCEATSTVDTPTAVMAPILDADFRVAHAGGHSSRVGPNPGLLRSVLLAVRPLSRGKASQKDAAPRRAFIPPLRYTPCMSLPFWIVRVRRRPSRAAPSPSDLTAIPRQWHRPASSCVQPLLCKLGFDGPNPFGYHFTTLARPRVHSPPSRAHSSWLARSEAVCGRLTGSFRDKRADARGTPEANAPLYDGARRLLDCAVLT